MTIEMIDMEVPLCRICNYPICSFICMDCMEQDIGEWLPKEISRDFEGFSRNFLRHVGDGEEIMRLNCIHCKKAREAAMCPFCYVMTVSRWLKERNRLMSEQLAGMFLLGSGRSGDGGQSKGRCDFCGEYSGSLKRKDAKLVCDDCSDWWLEMKYNNPRGFV